MGLAIIYIYDSTATDFTYNGRPLNKAYEVVVDNIINDSFFVTFNHPLDDKGKYKSIEKDKIVKVHTPDGMQPFRIMDRVKYMDHVSIEAWPLFYADMRNKLVKPLSIRGLSGQAAVSAFVNNLLIDTPFTFTSNITDAHDYHTQDTQERENNPNQLYNALDVFKDIVTRWQGELVVNGYDIRVVNRLGKNTGALLYEKKNISDFTDEESIQDVTTRLYGKSEWTERPQGSDEEVKHEISVKVESPLINAYSGIVFEKQYTNNDIRTEKEMKDWLNLKFTTDNIDKPSRNIKVNTNIVDDTIINLGDSLVLKYVKHDVDMEIRMVGYTYDGYANRYITVQLGDAKQSYVGSVQNTVREIETNVNTNVKQTVNQILNANGERMIYSVTEPVGNFKNGDVWFDQQGGMYFWDEESGMWIDHPYNRNMNVVADKVEDAAGKADEAVQAAKDSDAKAEAIKQGLGLADITLTNQQITDQIKADYNTVKQNSTNALTDAGKALTDAYNAQQAADKIIEDFEAFLTGDFASAENDIVTAQTTVTDALNKAGTAVSDLDTFKNDYNTFITDQFNPALTAATNALSLAEQNEGLFYSANLIDEVTGMSNVYTKSEIDGTNGYVTKSTFNANAESISSELERVEGVALSSGANINLLIVKNAKNNTWLDANPSERVYPTPNDTPNATATSPDLISVTAGEKITLSKTTTTADNFFRIDYLDANKQYVNRYTQSADVATITIPANVAYLWVSYPMNSYPKIERGEAKTQWTLAPQDQVNQSTVNYLTSKIEQTPELISEALTSYTPTDRLDDTVSSYLSNTTTKTAGAIDTKLTSYAKTTDLNGLATEEFATSKATETANGVKTELTAIIGTKVDEDTLDGYVSTATYNEGVEGITRSISTVEGKIPTAIGGRNLLRGTANFNTPLWRNVSTAMPSTRDSRYKQVRVDGDYTVAPITTMSTQQWNFEVGQDYVVSVWAKSEALGNRLGLTAQGTPYFEPQVVAVSEWRRFVWKFKATISNLANFRFETRNGERVWITQPQVEKGTIATDWTLAPEDLQTIDALDKNIVNLYNNTSSETSKAFSRTLTAYTPTSELDNKTKNYLTSNQYQTAEMVTTTLNSYTPTSSLDGTVANYLKSSSSQTAGAITTKLSDYQTKSDLDASVKSLFSNTSNQTAQYIDSKLSAYTTDESFDGKTQSYLTNNNYQTAEMVETKLTAYTPTTSLDSKTQAYLTSNQYQTASQVSTTLVAYTKTDSLDGTVASYLNNSTSQTAGAIATKLTAYTPTESLDAKTQSYLTNNSYQTASMVETKLADYQTKTTLDGSVASILDNTESQTAGKINSKLTDIQAQIPTEFGGRNLLRGTADFDTTLWRNVSTVVPSTRDSRYKQVRVDGDFNVAPITTMSVQGWNFEIGEEYVISVWAKSEELGNKLGVTAQSTPYFEPQVVTLSKWSRYTWTFTATISNLTNFRFETRNGERVWITQPQIEKGSIPTDWTRAVEDLATVSQTNEIERTANYTKSAITNVTASGLVTGSTVNQTKDGITERVASLDTSGNITYANRDVKLDSIVSTVANDRYISNIIQASDLVQSTIRENTNVDLLAKAAGGTGMTADPYFNKGINGLRVYDNANTNTISIYRNLTNDPNLPSGKGYRLDIYHASSTATSPNRGGVSLPTQSWANGVVVVRFTAKLEVGKSFAYGQNPIGTGSTHGWLTTNKGTGNWEQYAYYHRFGTSGTFDTFGFLSVDATSAAFTWRLADFDIINLGLSSQSQITQLQDNINLKVSNADLLSQINIQANGVLIQSGTNKLNVTPTTTYIEDGTIKSAMIESLVADKVTTGTLDGKEVNVINLDAENITSGNLKSINIVNTISYPSGGRTYTGDMTIAGGQISSYVTAGADYYKSIFINDRTIRLSNQDATLNMQAGNITFDGTLTGGGQIWYQDNLARLVAGSYNGFALATYRDGSFANRLSVGGWAGEELAPFVDVHATLNMRYQKIENINSLFLKASEGKTGAAMYATSDNNLAIGGTWGTIIGQLSSDGTTVYEFLKADQVSDRVRFAKNINMQGNTILNQSDERLKHNIYDLERDDLSILKDIKYKNFTFNNQDKETFGFIAQDIQKIMPSLITEEVDGLLSYDSMEYTHFIGHALQQHVTETATEIEKLKSQIVSLQDELALLKGV